MAFKFRSGINHSPDWYVERCRDENASASVRAMLKRDMAYIGADDQRGMVDTERIGVYRERWNAIQSGAENLRNSGGTVFRSTVLLDAIFTVIEREAMDGYRPFEEEPFTSIGKLMDEANVNENTMRQFLRWRSHRRSAARKKKVQQAESAKRRAVKDHASKLFGGHNPFFE